MLFQFINQHFLKSFRVEQFWYYLLVISIGVPEWHMLYNIKDDKLFQCLFKVFNVVIELRFFNSQIGQSNKYQILSHMRPNNIWQKFSLRNLQQHKNLTTFNIELFDSIHSLGLIKLKISDNCRTTTFYNLKIDHRVVTWNMMTLSKWLR